MAIERHLRELDRLGEDLGVLDREIAQAAIDNPAVKRVSTRMARACARSCLLIRPCLGGEAQAELPHSGIEPDSSRASGGVGTPAAENLPITFAVHADRQQSDTSRTSPAQLRLSKMPSKYT